MATTRCALASLVLLFIVINAFAEEKQFQCNELYQYNATAANPSGDVYSPFFGEKDYPDNLWCEYQINFPPGYRLKITFKELDIDPSSFCSQDALAIYGTVNRENMLDRVCGTDLPEPIITYPDVKVVKLLFTSDFMGRGKGFHLHYEASPSFEICPRGFRQCKMPRKCYDPKKTCDGNDDCGDGTDEEGCGLPLATAKCGRPVIKPDTIWGRYSPDRVIGGRAVIPGSWPWQVSLQYRYEFASHACGGTLINSQWIVTAAHCFKGNPYPDGWRVHVGKHHKFKKGPYEQIRYGERLIIYPDLTGDNIIGRSYSMAHDIALLKLNAPVKFNDGVLPACLPSFGWDLPTGSTCYITGWGETRGSGFSDELKQTDVSMMSTMNCSSYDPKTQICVKNAKGFQSTCHGDSGGPLACLLGDRWYVMGGTSYGTMSNLMTGLCAMPGQRTVFMKVSDKSDWIKKMIEQYG